MAADQVAALPLLSFNGRAPADCVLGGKTSKSAAERITTRSFFVFELFFYTYKVFLLLDVFAVCSGTRPFS